MVLYLFTDPPLSPFLNEMFMRLDAAFPLFGTAAFALFCFYLIGGPAPFLGPYHISTWLYASVLACISCCSFVSLPTRFTCVFSRPAASLRTSVHSTFCPAWLT